MGMYDNMGGQQIKCFYQPVISHDIDSRFGLPPVDKLNMWAMGGSLKTYRRFSKVPYKTMYYDYGKNFLIFDPRNPDRCNIIHVILGGRYAASLTYNQLRFSHVPIDTVIDHYGNRVNITRKEDFEYMLEEYMTMKINHNSIVRELAKDKSKSVEEYNTEVNEHIRKSTEGFEKKWFTDFHENQDPWHVGGFLSGIISFCTSNAMVAQYVRFFRKEHESKDISRLLMSYALWCSEHEIKIKLKDLEVFFMEAPTANNLVNVVKNIYFYKPPLI